MRNLVRSLSLVLSSALFICWAVPCRAAENAFKEVFTDSCYGGLTGTLVGAAVLAFAKKPGDHLDYMLYGGATGVMVGAAYGLGKAMVEMNNGKVKLSLPLLLPDVGDTNSRGQTPVTIVAKVLRGNF